jgi:hypothetical protein
VEKWFYMCWICFRIHKLLSSLLDNMWILKQFQHIWNHFYKFSFFSFRVFFLGENFNFKIVTCQKSQALNCYQKRWKKWFCFMEFFFERSQFGQNNVIHWNYFQKHPKLTSPPLGIPHVIEKKKDLWRYFYSKIIYLQLEIQLFYKLNALPYCLPRKVDTDSACSANLRDWWSRTGD